MILPSSIASIIGNRPYQLDDVGLSDSQVLIFDDMVLKIQPDTQESQNERFSMNWLHGKLPVPKIIRSECHDGISYLLMSRVEGEMSCASQYINNPDLLVDILAEGLKMLWSVDAKSCPCDNRLDKRLKSAEYIVQNGLVDLDNVEPDTFGENGFKNPTELLLWLKENRPEEDIVFTHGDYCLPNLFAKNRHVSGFIDLGKAGLADRYQDIAICYRSIKHNLAGLYGGHEPIEYNADTLFERLGIEPDWDKIRYFTLLDELF